MHPHPYIHPDREPYSSTILSEQRVKTAERITCSGSFMVNIFQRYILWYFLPKAKRALFKPFHLCAENALSFSLSLSLSLPGCVPSSRAAMTWLFWQQKHSKRQNYRLLSLKHSKKNNAANVVYPIICLFDYLICICVCVFAWSGSCSDRNGDIPDKVWKE